MSVPVPPHVAPYVNALGVDRAIEFFLRFGGTGLYLAARPGTGSQRILEITGEAGLKALHDAFGSRVRVPVPKAWMARELDARGLTVVDISRRLHVTEPTVRSYLRGDTADADQLSLAFGE